MDQGQTNNYINAALAFLNRTNLTGQESETLVEVKRWLMSLSKPAPAAQPAVSGEDSSSAAD